MNHDETRRQAEERMAAAKRQFSEAAKAAMRGDSNSSELATAAFAAVEAARAEIRSLPFEEVPHG